MLIVMFLDWVTLDFGAVIFRWMVVKLARERNSDAMEARQAEFQAGGMGLGCLEPDPPARQREDGPSECQECDSPDQPYRSVRFVLLFPIWSV